MSLLGKSCSKNKEYNPYTKRCNKKCLPSEERILNAKKRSFKCLKKCKPGTQRQKTNRCTKGKKTGKSKSKSVSGSLIFYDAKEKLRKTKTPSASQSLEYFYADKQQSDSNYSNAMRK